MEVWCFFATLATALGVGAVLAFASSRFMTALRDDAPVHHHSNLLRHVRLLAVRLALQAGVVAVFAFGALAANAWLNAAVPVDQETVVRIVTAITWPWFGLVVARFMFAPCRPDLRLCAIEDVQAGWLTRQILLACTIFYAGFGFTGWLNAFGSVYRDSWHGFWVNLAVHVAQAATLWQGRFVLRRILRGGGPRGDAEGREPALCRPWPTISVSLVVIHWLIIEIVVANAYLPESLFIAMATTSVLLVALPFGTGIGRSGHCHCCR